MFHFTFHFFLLGGKMQHITKKEPLNTTYVPYNLCNVLSAD